MIEIVRILGDEVHMCTDSPKNHCLSADFYKVAKRRLQSQFKMDFEEDDKIVIRSFSYNKMPQFKMNCYITKDEDDNYCFKERIK